MRGCSVAGVAGVAEFLVLLFTLGLWSRWTAFWVAGIETDSIPGTQSLKSLGSLEFFFLFTNSLLGLWS